jgi:Ca2+ transporting ATPase
MDTLKKKYKVYKTDDFIRYPFTSSRKRMSTVISNAHGKDAYNKRLLIKGASELITKCCSYYLNAEGKQCNFEDSQRSIVDAVIKSYAQKALRTIALAYRDLEPNQYGEKHDEPRNSEVKDVEKSGLTLIAILGIYDVIRTEVPGAVKTCQAAGVTVRMVTGDNIITAQAIAELCNIITAQEIGDPQVCMEGPEFYKEMGGLICLECKLESPNDCKCETDKRRERVRNFAAFKSLMPKMKVMARSRPEDKYLLVTGLMNMGNVVAVTGDGTNDAPALSKADVGFGMGITGTAVCKAAADIIIMDDSFNSVVKACSWGRNVFDNIKRFL